jgi:hypothetical protein
MSAGQDARTRQRITKRLVDGLGTGDTVWDSELTGFGVRRQRRNASFVLKYTFRGRQRFYTIGRHGLMTADEARIEARRLLGLAASGIDPATAREKRAPEFRDDFGRGRRESLSGAISWLTFFGDGASSRRQAKPKIARDAKGARGNLQNASRAMSCTVSLGFWLRRARMW